MAWPARRDQNQRSPMANVSYILNPLRNPWFWVLFGCFFAMYTGLGLSLQEAGILSEEHRHFSFQARAVWSGDPGGLGIIGLEDPPIPFVPYLMMIRPVIAASFIAAFSMAFLILFILAYYRTWQVKVFLTLLLMISPSMLFLSLQSPRTMIFIMLNILSFYFLMEFSVKEESFFIMLFGLIFGTLVLVNFHIIILIVFLIIFFIAFFKKLRVLEYTFVAVFPMLFLFLSWILLNFVFSNQPVAVIQGWFDTFSPKAGLDYLIRFLHSSGFLLAIYGFTIVVAGKFIRFFQSPLFFVLIMPWCSLILLGFFNDPDVYVANSKLLLINYIILFPYIGQLLNERRFRNILACFFVLTILWEFAGVRRNHEEHIFFQWLTGQPVVSQAKESESLLAHFSDQERVWVTDKSLYSTLYFTDDLSRWILPNQTEHTLAALQPQLYVGWVFTTADDVRTYHGFELIHATSRFKILRNLDPELLEWGKELRYSP